MKLAAALAVAISFSAPLIAQDTLPSTPESEDLEEGTDLMREGARRLLRGLMGEVEPAMRDLADALERWDFDALDLRDLGQYDPPEVLPNGDIIIRRKTPRDTPMDGEIEL